MWGLVCASVVALAHAAADVKHCDPVTPAKGAAATTICFETFTAASALEYVEVSVNTGKWWCLSASFKVLANGKSQAMTVWNGKSQSMAFGPDAVLPSSGSVVVVVEDVSPQPLCPQPELTAVIASHPVTPKPPAPTSAPPTSAPAPTDVPKTSSPGATTPAPGTTTPAPTTGPPRTEAPVPVPPSGAATDRAPTKPAVLLHAALMMLGLFYVAPAASWVRRYGGAVYMQGDVQRRLTIVLTGVALACLVGATAVAKADRFSPSVAAHTPLGYTVLGLMGLSCILRCVAHMLFKGDESHPGRWTLDAPCTFLEVVTLAAAVAQSALGAVSLHRQWGVPVAPILVCVVVPVLAAAGAHARSFAAARRAPLYVEIEEVSPGRAGRDAFDPHSRAP